VLRGEGCAGRSAPRRTGASISALHHPLRPVVSHPLGGARSTLTSSRFGLSGTTRPESSADTDRSGERARRRCSRYATARGNTSIRSRIESHRPSCQRRCRSPLPSAATRRCPTVRHRARRADCEQPTPDAAPRLSNRKHVVSGPRDHRRTHRTARRGSGPLRPQDPRPHGRGRPSCRADRPATDRPVRRPAFPAPRLRVTGRLRLGSSLVRRSARRARPHLPATVPVTERPPTARCPHRTEAAGPAARPVSRPLPPHRAPHRGHAAHPTRADE